MMHVYEVHMYQLYMMYMYHIAYVWAQVVILF